MIITKAKPMIDPGSGEKPAIPFDNRILYFGRDRDQFGFLSHFHPSPIELDGETWPTVEHYYQAQRSDDPAYRQTIRAAETPGKAKRLAARTDLAKKRTKRSWFYLNNATPRADWHEIKLDIMRRADRAKFSQNPELECLLRETASAKLIEDSPWEPFWGIGQDGQGLNWAGRVLMEIRVELVGYRPALNLE
jgi:N-glycosidase YbiA